METRKPVPDRQLVVDIDNELLTFSSTMTRIAHPIERDAPDCAQAGAHHPVIGDIRDLLTFRLAMLAAAGDRVGQRWLLAEFGLRIMEWRVLGLVASLQPVRFLVVAQNLLVDKGQLSRLVRSLGERGLIETEPDPNDQRTIRLRTTGKGGKLASRVLARAFERNELVVSALEPSEIATLFALLDKLQPFMTHRAGRGEEETGADMTSRPRPEREEEKCSRNS